MVECNSQLFSYNLGWINQGKISLCGEMDIQNQTFYNSNEVEIHSGNVTFSGIFSNDGVLNATSTSFWVIQGDFIQHESGVLVLELDRLTRMMDVKGLANLGGELDVILDHKWSGVIMTYESHVGSFHNTRDSDDRKISVEYSEHELLVDVEGPKGWVVIWVLVGITVTVILIFLVVFVYEKLSGSVSNDPDEEDILIPN
jgi:hypothetical protein